MILQMALSNPEDSKQGNPPTVAVAVPVDTPKEPLTTNQLILNHYTPIFNQIEMELVLGIQKRKGVFLPEKSKGQDVLIDTLLAMYRSLTEGKLSLKSVSRFTDDELDEGCLVIRYAKPSTKR